MANISKYLKSLVSSLASVATSGSYNDLTDKPTISTAGTSGSYNDLTDKPTISTAGASGSYTDLTNKPTLGTAAALNVGNNANEVLQLDANAKLPAVDGSQLTGMSSAYNNLVLLLSASANNSAVIDFTNFTSSNDYQTYLLICRDIIVQNAGATILCKFSRDNGVNWVSGSYFDMQQAQHAGGAFFDVNRYQQGVFNFARVTSDQTGMGINSLYHGCHGEIRFFGLKNNLRKHARAEFNYQNGGSGSHSAVKSSFGLYDDGQSFCAAVNAFRLYLNSGNFVAGEFKLYGIKEV